MTPSDLAYVLTIMLVGILAGNEFCTLIIHRALESLPVAEAMPAVRLIVRHMGTIMPVLMPTSMVMVLVMAWLADGTASVLLTVAAVLIVIMIAITFAGLMPLNTRQLDATERTPEPEWRTWRQRWLQLHGIRNALDLGALALVATSALLS